MSRRRIDVADSVEPEYTADRTWTLTWFEDRVDAPLNHTEVAVSIRDGYAEVDFLAGEPTDAVARQAVLERAVDLERERRAA